MVYPGWALDWQGRCPSQPPPYPLRFCLSFLGTRTTRLFGDRLSIAGVNNDHGLWQLKPLFFLSDLSVDTNLWQE
jgi:hypothetical protein